MWRSSLAMRSLLHNSCSPGKWLIMHPGGNFDRRLRDGKALANTKSASVGSLVGTKPPVASVRRIKEMDPLPTFRSSILWRNLRWLAGGSYWQSHSTRVETNGKHQNKKVRKHHPGTHEEHVQDRELEVLHRAHHWCHLSYANECNFGWKDNLPAAKNVCRGVVRVWADWSVAEKALQGASLPRLAIDVGLRQGNVCIQIEVDPLGQTCRTWNLKWPH